MKKELQCIECGSHFFIEAEKHPDFCSFCGAPFRETSLSEISFVQEHKPDEKNIQFTIGPYQALELIGKGGMGEVYLAYDKSCGRRIALKRIRGDYKNHASLAKRFLKEARITAQLTHPSIIPIYSIHEDGKNLYYTMPFVEGKTLKEIIRRARAVEKKGERSDSVGASIPSLARIFLSLCQAISYAHNHGVIHRDIKGENIIVGKFGEVMLLDWGLAKLVNGEREEDLPENEEIGKTKVGKIVGTLSYMAPERALGAPATIQSDIFSLGVLLFVLLTLRSPYKRGTIEEFKKNVDKEIIPEPSELAPHRDVPPLLTSICKRCLAKDPKDRYQNLEDLIHDLENYIEGRSDWFHAGNLSIRKKRDWQFQENVLLAEQTAITRAPEEHEWVSLMISKASFHENCRLETTITVGEKCQGIGFLLNIPEETERKALNDGYCLWIGSEVNRTTRLLRSTVEVLSAPEINLTSGEKHRICIENTDSSFRFFLNGKLQFSYISHLPLSGTHVGILCRDEDFKMGKLRVFVGNQNLMVSCLEIPDAFLAHKNYDLALSEYKRIAYTFPGRVEGREAKFRAGITLLEKAKQTGTRKLYDLALKEFEELHGTPGAPLEYLGKGLVYKTLEDYEEELKCYHLAYRRYPRHPQLMALEEQVIYRLHESSRQNRITTYSLALLINQYIPKAAKLSQTKRLFRNIQKHWEILPFYEHDPCTDHIGHIANYSFNILLSFWLGNEFFLEELFTELLEVETLYPITLCNNLFCLLELGSYKIVESLIDKAFEERPQDEAILKKYFTPLALGVEAHKKPIEEVIDVFVKTLGESIQFFEMRVLLFLLERAIDFNKPDIVISVLKRINTEELDLKQKTRLDSLNIEAHLLKHNYEEVGEIFSKYPIEMTADEKSFLFFLYGCSLAAVEGPEIAKAHFSGILEVPFPRTWTLGAHAIIGRLKERWYKQAFLWEKKQLERQLKLYENFSHSQ